MHLAMRVGSALCVLGLGSLIQAGCTNSGTNQSDGGDLGPAADLLIPVPPPAVNSSWVFDHPKPQGNTLYAVLNSVSSAYAVGDIGALVQLTDTGGTRQAIGQVQSTLRAIATTSTDLWAVGDGGIVLHGQNGSNFSTMLAGTSALYAVWTQGGTVFAAGQGANLWQNAGQGFVSTPLTGASPSGSIRAALTVQVSGATETYLVGSAGAAGGQILHQQAGQWFTEGDSLATEDLNSVAADPSGAIYAVGVAGRILRRDPIKPLLTRAELVSVWYAGTTMFAVAMDGTALRRTANGWVLDGATGAPGLIFAGGPSGTGGASGSWAVGQSGTVLRRGPADTDQWAAAYPTTELTISGLNAVTTNTTDAYAVTQDGRVLHRTGSGNAAAWTVDYSLPAAQVQNLNGVSAQGDEVYAVGMNGTILHKTAAAGWQVEALPNALLMTLGRNPDLRGVWLNKGGASADLYAVGSVGAGDEDSVILHKVGSTWSLEGVDVMADLFAVLGNGNDVVAVGSYGSMLSRNHDNSGNWTQEGVGLVQDIELYGLTYVGDTFYAVGSRGTVMTRSPAMGNSAAMWQKTTIPQVGTNLYGVVSVGSDLWAIGGAGFAAHYHGSAWTVESTLSESNLSGAALLGNSVLAVGSGGAALLRDLSGNN
jgi:hypothetical protein